MSSIEPKAYLVKVQTTVSNSDNESTVYFAGDVVSDWELTDHIKQKISEGSPWYTNKFEPLTEREAELYRKKATATEGKRTAPDGQVIDPPWDDFIGLHPKEVIERIKNLTADDVEKVRQYERAGLNRSSIIEYVAPSEREPWHEYDQWSVRDILDKLSILDEKTVQDVIVYEFNHRKRPAIMEYTPEEYSEGDISETSPPEDRGEDGDDTSDRVPVGVGAGATDAGGQP